MSNKRTDLSKVLPLETPFSLHVFPSYYCNFHCLYCLHSLSSEQLKKRNFKREFLSFDIYKKAIDGLKGYPKLKAIIYAGHGEPLMHKDIAAMVDYAIKANVSDRTEVVTNASLLNKEMADNLIAADLSILRISLQGVTDEMYKKVGGTNFRIADIVSNIKYFYNNKNNTKIHLKIINIGLNNEKEKEIFYELFNPITDVASIEYVIPFIEEIDHSSLTDDLSKCKLGHDKQPMSKICSMPFYMLALEPNGNLIPCCSSIVPYVYGNLKNNDIMELWDSKKHNDFLCMQLTDLTQNKVCKVCSVPQFGLQEGDYLDEDRERLLEIYQNRRTEREY